MADKKEAPKEDKKGGGMKLILIAVVVLLLLVGVGVGAYMLGASGSDDGEKEDEKIVTPKKKGNDAPAPIGPLVAMEDFIVNILDAEETRYLKASMTLELDGPEVAAEVEERKPQVRDAILLFMSSKSFDELRDLQGKLQLRADLIGRINALLALGEVKTIYFTDFVVQ